MATKILKQMPPMEGVVPGEKATLDLPIGPRYHKYICEGTVKPDAGSIATLDDIMGLIKLFTNGKAQREATALEIAALNLLNGPEFAVQVENLDNPGNPLANGDKARFRLTILLGEPFRKSYAAGEIMAWPTQWVKDGRTVAELTSLQLEIGVPNVSGYTLHDIKVYATVDARSGNFNQTTGLPIFNISKWYRETITYTASGDRHLTTLPKRDTYQQMNFFTQVGDTVSQIRIKRDGEEILDVPKRINDHDLVDYGINGDALSDDRFDVIFDRDDLPDSAMPMDGVREFEVILTLDAAAAANKVITLIRQVYGPRD